MDSVMGVGPDRGFSLTMVSEGNLESCLGVCV